MSDKDATREYAEIGRRELLRRWGVPAAAAAVLAATGGVLHGRPGRHLPPDRSVVAPPPDWRVDPAATGRLAIAGGGGPTENARRCLQALGGIERFVKRGEKVAIKPNVAWDRTPEQAATTNPELVAELVKLCLAAGAASVVVVDNSCHDPKRTFARSGVAAAAEAAGAKVLHQGNAGSVLCDLGGTRLGQWEVLRPLVEADRVINVPIVKHHSLSHVTVGMKNWIGAVLGPRSGLHQRIAQVTAELGAAFRPTLTVVDATRILVGGGPTGGSLSLVKELGLLAATTDPVAADAWGASLLELEPRQLPHLEIAARLGLGSADWESLKVEA